MTDQQQPRPPLWRVMEHAFITGRQPGYSDHPGYAAEIRAAADEVVPECDCPDGDIVSRAMWLARARVRDRLLDEADRAEAGE